MIEGSQHGFSLDANPFFLRIAENSSIFDKEKHNAISILLPARLNDELRWKEEIEKAEEFVQNGTLIFWQLDLGLEEGALILTDPALFFSFGIALEQFTQQLWPAFKEKSLGVSLYRGAFTTTERLVWDAGLEEHYAQYRKGSLLSEPVSKQLFSTNIFAEFLHRLISYLPVEVAPFCQFDTESIKSLALQSLLFSRARFEYLHLGIKGCALPLRGLTWERGSSIGGWIGESAYNSLHKPAAQIGLIIPQDASLSCEIIEKLEETLAYLLKQDASFRMISELHLTEEWDGIETLISIPEAISPQGVRMLKGFAATGGKIVESAT
ncbi:MAG: hypothetical protein HYX48_05155 [Chlamydiales bacterium]|nr:hypothetical protein [Chlamydiales bacterium]